METCIDEITPVMEVANDCIVSKKGDITVVFKVELPEIFSLSDADYEAMHQIWIKALKVLPKFSTLHKQDWFIEDKVSMVRSENDSFLAAASARHFEGRKYLKHECYIMLTKLPANSKVATSSFSSLLKKGFVPEQLLNERLFQEFLDVTGQFKSIIEENGYIRLTRLTNDDLQSNVDTPGFIERYYQLNNGSESPLLQDITFDNGIQVGNKHCQLYTLADVADMPALAGSRITYDKFSTDRTKFPVGFASSIGHLLPCNHIYNQFIVVGDAQASIKKLESKKLRLQSLAAYSRENMVGRDAVNAFLNEAVADQRLPVRAHYNLMVWSEQRDDLKDIKNLVTAALARMDATARLETVGQAQIWWACIPGNASELPDNETFTCFGEQAACFFNLESAYRSVPKETGIRFCDRQYNRPVFTDLYDLPRMQGRTTNMGTLVCGSSGGGKSMTVNHILSTLHDQGAHCVVLDIGGSYKGLCELKKGYYFTYEESNPIQLNPFYLPEGQTLDTEKKESLKSLLVALWKQESEQFHRSEYIALSNALQGYYRHLELDKNVFPCFNTFYEYLTEHYTGEIARHNLQKTDFDVANFLYVLHPYYKGGEFSYLLNARENLDILNQSFVVYEMDNIKDHPILLPVILLTLVENFLSKMRKLKGVRKVLCIDEAWKAISSTGMAEFAKYAFKTIRKFNGVPIVSTQELDDLINSPVIKDAIINNADIKILMDMRKFMNKFDKLQETLGLSEKAKTILLSVNKDDREICIDIGGQDIKVYRNELCAEEYYAYTTEGKERVQVLDYAERHGSMEAGINALISDKRNHSKTKQV